MTLPQLRDIESRHQDEKIALVRRALLATGFNATRAAKLIGVTRPTVLRYIGLDPGLGSEYDTHKSGAGRPGKINS